MRRHANSILDVAQLGAANPYRLGSTIRLFRVYFRLQSKGCGQARSQFLLGLRFNDIAVADNDALEVPIEEGLNGSDKGLPILDQKTVENRSPQFSVESIGFEEETVDQSFAEVNIEDEIGDDEGSACEERRIHSASAYRR